MNQSAEKIADQLFYLIENAVEQVYYPGYKLYEHAKEEGFRVADVKDEDVASIVLPKLEKLISDYLSSARVDEQDMEESK